MAWFSDILRAWHARRYATALHKYRRSVDVLTRQIDALQRRRADDEQRLATREALLATFKEESDRQFDATAKGIEAARNTARLQEVALEAANDKIRTLEDVTVRGLVAANETFIARWEAESAVQTARAVSATPLRAVEDG